MIEWYRILSFFFTNGIRISLCLFLLETLLNLPQAKKKTALLSLTASVLITVLSLFSIPQLYLAGAETILLAAAIYGMFRRDLRMALFLIFFYELGTALWEFLISAGLGILFRSDLFLQDGTLYHMAAVWIVRLLMLGTAVFAARNPTPAGSSPFRPASAISVLGLFGIVAISEQSVLPLDNERITVWLIFSVLLMVAVLFFHMNRQYEMEREIARLKAEQAEFLERDYRTLNRTYSAHAKLFHDFHNHVEVLYRYLTQGKTEEAAAYLEAMRTPVQEMMRTVWTGEEAIDYLINSKMSAARQAGIRTDVNIEFPPHTNIRSIDLTAILGNLLDNALEAAGSADGRLRFIRLTVRRIHNIIVIKVENGCSAASAPDTGEWQTSKEENGLHGWGLKNARSAADRYEGTIELSCENHIFRAVATLFYEPVRT